MIKYKLIINSFAEQDMEDACMWYNLKKKRLCNEFIEELDTVFIRIVNNPFQFPLFEKKIRKAIINQFPYSVFFYIEKEIVNVFAVFHTHRNPKVWKKRINK